MSKTTEVSKALLEHLHKLEGEQIKGDMNVNICTDILERKIVLYRELPSDTGKGLNALIPGDEELARAENDLKVGA